MRRAAFALGCALAVAASALAAPECPAPTGSVRVMLHDPELLAARLTLLANAAPTSDGRVAAMRSLFAAAGCTQIEERGDAHGRNVECTVSGSGDRTLLVGVSQQFDSLASLALLPSLAEALAAAPRKHTIRWVAFSAHGALEESGRTALWPKGAMRLLSTLPAAERAKLDGMVHLGPLGYGPILIHPREADERMQCALDAASRVAGLPLGVPRAAFGDCIRTRDFGRFGRLPTYRLERSECPEGPREGSIDWMPFRSAGIAVLGVHSDPAGLPEPKLDSGLYLKSYRMLAIFLALADDALAPQSASAEAPAAATSPR